MGAGAPREKSHGVTIPPRQHRRPLPPRSGTVGISQPGARELPANVTLMLGGVGCGVVS